MATAQPTATTGPGNATAAPASPSGKKTTYEKSLRFTHCMTAHGAPTADPVEGKPIRGGGGILSGESFDDYFTRQAAYEKCKQFMPVIWPVKVDPKTAAHARAYDQCLRKHGIPVPIPDKNGLMNEPIDNRLFRMPGYEAALPAPVRRPGQQRPR